MSKIFFTFILFLLVLTNNCLGWEKFYDSKERYYDLISDLEIDFYGNIYVTGESGGIETGSDYVTIKYSPTGQQLWIARYFEQGTSYDYANALALDNLGNVFVTGNRVTIKYNNNGIQQWTDIFDTNGSSQAISIATDEFGFIYVLGTKGYPGTMSTIKYNTNGSRIWEATTPGSAVKIIIDKSGNVLSAGGYGNKLKVAKYNPDGSLLWENVYVGNPSYAAYLYDLTTDKFDNVFITGTTYQAVGGTARVIKYNQSGQLLWIDTVLDNQNTRINSLTTDSIGNLYMTGYKQACYIAKYGVNGNIIWEKYYNIPNQGNNGISVALDKNLNVNVAGSIYETSTWLDFNTVKYSNNGQQMWVKRYNGSASRQDEAFKIEVDNFSDIVVGGSTTSIATGWDYALLKYNQSGDLLWSNVYSGPPSDEYSESVAVDDSGNVYLSGYGWGNETSLDFLTLKYDADGTQKWLRRYDGPLNDSDLICSSVNTNNGVYVTGSSKGINSQFDFLTIRYSSTGTQELASRYNSAGNGNDIAIANCLDGLGNLYITGKSNGQGTDYDILTVKYAPNGNLLWAVRYNGISNSTDEPNSIVVDESGYIYVTGKSYNNNSNFDFVTIKYSNTGNLQWVSFYNNTENNNDESKSIIVNQNGSVYVTGNSFLNLSKNDIVTVKYNANGQQLWATRFDGSSSLGDVVENLDLDNSGNIYVTGSVQNNNSGYDFITNRYDSSGNLIWSRNFNSSYNLNDFLNAMSVSDSNFVFVSGKCYKDLNNFDLIILKYNTLGQLLSERTVTYNYSIEPSFIRNDEFDYVYLCGNAYSSSGGSNLYVAKFSSSLSTINQISNNAVLYFSLSQNYPNPFNPTTKIKFDIPVGKGRVRSVQLIIYDILGREVTALVNEQLKPGTYEVDWNGSNYSSGVYFYKLIAGDFIETKKMVLMK